MYSSQVASVVLSGMSLNNSLAALVSKLAIPGERANSARDLAAYLGAEGLIVFIKDPEIEVLLPAPGFRQTFLYEIPPVQPRHHQI